MKLLLGTASGAYVLEGEAAWKRLRVRGPLLGRHVVSALAHGEPGLLAAVGATLHASRDGLSWTAVGHLPEQPLPARITALAHMGDALVAGTEPAGVWLGNAGGTVWRELTGLRNHPSAAEWWGAAGKPAIQAIAVDPEGAGHLFAAVSIAGIFHGPADAAADQPWSAANTGLPPLYPRESEHFEAHRDVRNLLALPHQNEDASLLIAATSHGIFASARGDQWYPRAGDWAWPGVNALTASPGGNALYAAPHLAMATQAHDAHLPGLAVYRSRDRARTWESLTSGLTRAARGPIHRSALAVAGAPGEPDTAYLGTSRGEVY